MSSRMLTLAILAAVCAFSASCTLPPLDQPPEYGTIQGIHSGQTHQEVIAALGYPQARQDGWWADSVQCDMGFEVWYYKKVGRVVFSGLGAVYTSEADPAQEGRSDFPD